MIEVDPAVAIPPDPLLRVGRVSALLRFSSISPLPFLDVEAPATHAFLSDVLAKDLVALGYPQPLDLSAVTNQDRRLSRLIAAYAYPATEVDGTSLYSGIRYMSRVGSDWECWAIFEGSSVVLLDQRPIELDDAARLGDLGT